MAAVGTLEPWPLVTALAKVSTAAHMVAGLAVSLGSCFLICTPRCGQHSDALPTKEISYLTQGLDRLNGFD